MAKENRLPNERINWFDGQRVTETDLDIEQAFVQKVTSELALDSIGSGIVQENPFETKVLLDTRFPGLYASSNENPSKVDLEGGQYDGLPIFLDRQVSDTVRGNRVELDLLDSNARGRDSVKVMILGRAFDGVDSEGSLVSEFFTFNSNTKKVSQNFYREIIAVYFNNFSGGLGRTEYLSSKESLDLISENDGGMIIREAPPLSVYSQTEMSYQKSSPNWDLKTFITSDVNNTIKDEIEAGLGTTTSIGDLYFDLEGIEDIKFEKDASTAISYGQKFLAKSNNIQRVDILLSVEENISAPIGSEFDWSGELVLSIHELATEADCPTDSVPDDLIDYDPEITPLIEVAFSQEDFEDLGYKLSDIPQVVSFNLSGTLLADPSIEPSIEKDRHYAFLISRRGDNRTGTIVLKKGYTLAAGKTEKNVPLTIFDQFGKQESKFFEFDPNTKRYINNSNASLWYIVHSNSIEITDGTAYAEDGVAITLPKTQEFVGNSEISYFENNIPLADITNNNMNYVILSHVQEFTSPDTHPRTNNFVFTRITDSASASVINSTDLSSLLEEGVPLIMAKVEDKNVRDSENISGQILKPGLLKTNQIIIESPSDSLLSEELVGRTFVPDTDCNCNAIYRITKTECLELLSGDLDRDGKITSNDVLEMLDVAGNTINSEDTERSILGGELDVVNFILSDLNDDESVDGDDIELLEDAVDGYVNFTKEERQRFLIISLENILEESDYPEIYSDTSGAGSTVGDSNTIDITVSENAALIIRPGDFIEIQSGDDAGNYRILTKTVSSDFVSVSLTVEGLSEEDISFVGSSGFNFVITSGTKVNLFADNNKLVDVPFTPKNYEIVFVETPFDSQFVEVCDLRRFVGATFIEKEDPKDCVCNEVGCLGGEDCSPVYKNQTYVPGDLYIPSGELLESPGVPYHGDYEYVNIKMPLPPGSINDCSIDLYNTFIKADVDGCTTAAGYPAMKYSDGTYVGCEDDGLNTDITKGRVKFSKSISSLYVDSLIDGYGVDGYADITDSSNNIESIEEDFVDYTYTGFSSWSADPGNNTAITNISNPAGINSPAVFEITTSNDSGVRYGRLTGPAESLNFEGDFIVDFSATRTAWPESSLFTGEISSFATLTISNDDGSLSTLKLGWKQTGGSKAKIFYSGIKEDSSLSILNTFEYLEDAPDSVGDEVLFRFRREGDVVKAYYLVPGQLSDTSISNFGGYSRIGLNPDVQPGKGSVVAEFEIAQENSPNAGISFFTRLSSFIIQSEYLSSSTNSSITLGRNSSTNEISRGTWTFPLNLTSKTNIVSAKLILNSEISGTFNDLFNIIPIDILNADNLGRIYNLPITQDNSEIISFRPGTIAVGDTIEVDITTTIVSLLSASGHLPGQIKAYIIEPNSDSNESIVVESSAKIEIDYEDITTGVIFKVGINLDPETGIATFNTKNVLYDALTEENRTVINFGVYLKKAGFRNNDITVSIDDLQRIGIGTCIDEDVIDNEDECFFIAGDTSTGTFVQGPFPCNFKFPT